MASKVVLITGANTGIGLEAVKAMMKSPEAYTIVLGARSPEKVDEAVKALKAEYPDSKSVLETIQVDLESDESIAKALEQFKSKHDKLDVLVNNGGASFDFDYPDKLSLREVYNKAYNVNVAGTQVMTDAFMPLLVRGTQPRLVFLTSGLSTLQGAHEAIIPSVVRPPPGSDRSSGGFPFPAGWPKPAGTRLPSMAYRSSKTALNMAAQGWHWLLLADGVKVFTISPGFLATGLGVGNPEFLRKMGAGPPSQGGEIICAVVEGKRDADAGLVITPSGTQPW